MFPFSRVGSAMLAFSLLMIGSILLVDNTSAARGERLDANLVHPTIVTSSNPDAKKIRALARASKQINDYMQTVAKQAIDPIPWTTAKNYYTERLMKNMTDMRTVFRTMQGPISAEKTYAQYVADVRAQAIIFRDTLREARGTAVLTSDPFEISTDDTARVETGVVLMQRVVTSSLTSLLERFGTGGFTESGNIHLSVESDLATASLNATQYVSVFSFFTGDQSSNFVIEGKFHAKDTLLALATDGSSLSWQSLDASFSATLYMTISNGDVFVRVDNPILRVGVLPAALASFRSNIASASGSLSSIAGKTYRVASLGKSNTSTLQIKTFQQVLDLLSRESLLTPFRKTMDNGSFALEPSKTTLQHIMTVFGQAWNEDEFQNVRLASHYQPLIYSESGASHTIATTIVEPTARGRIALDSTIDTFLLSGDLANPTNTTDTMTFRITPDSTDLHAHSNDGSIDFTCKNRTLDATITGDDHTVTASGTLSFAESDFAIALDARTVATVKTSLRFDDAGYTDVYAYDISLPEMPEVGLVRVILSGSATGVYGPVTITAPTQFEDLTPKTQKQINTTTQTIDDPIGIIESMINR